MTKPHIMTYDNKKVQYNKITIQPLLSIQLR